eukprot:scaffold41776_cov39-Phaeocystis_antarctica.AAC.1
MHRPSRHRPAPAHRPAPCTAPVRYDDEVLRPKRHPKRWRSAPGGATAVTAPVGSVSKDTAPTGT